LTEILFLNNAVQNGGDVDFRFPDLRHCFCAKLAQKEVDIYRIVNPDEHEDIRMTKRYFCCLGSLRDGAETPEASYNGEKITGLKHHRSFHKPLVYKVSPEGIGLRPTV